jgi:putative membrane protein
MIRNFLIRLVINAVALAVTAWLLDGITVSNQIGPLLLVAVLFGLVNAIIKPFVKLISLPLTVATLGLFSIVINALMLLLTSWLTSVIFTSEDFHVDGLITAIIGGIVLGIVATIVEWILDRLGLDEDKG